MNNLAGRLAIKSHLGQKQFFMRIFTSNPISDSIIWIRTKIHTNPHHKRKNMILQSQFWNVCGFMRGTLFDFKKFPDFPRLSGPNRKESDFPTFEGP